MKYRRGTVDERVRRRQRAEICRLRVALKRIRDCISPTCRLGQCCRVVVGEALGAGRRWGSR